MDNLNIVWVSVSERLPKAGVGVAVVDNGVVKYGYLRDPTFLGPKSMPWMGVHGVLYGVTHWTPMPDPPKDAK